MTSPRYSNKRKSAVKEGFRSGIEQDFAAVYPDMAYEPKSFAYTVCENRKYTPDFVDRWGTWYELKGRFTASDRKKMKQVQTCYPSQLIIFVFQAPYNKLTKAPKSKTYAQWAEDNGFKWVSLKDAKEGKLLDD